MEIVDNFPSVKRPKLYVLHLKGNIINLNKYVVYTMKLREVM